MSSPATKGFRETGAGSQQHSPGEPVPTFRRLPETMHPPENMFLTSREAASLLRIGRTKLWELTRDGEIPAYRVGTGRTSPLRYKRLELLRWMDAHRIGPGSAELPRPARARRNSPSV